jgi:hypothetical protein
MPLQPLQHEKASTACCFGRVCAGLLVGPKNKKDSRKGYSAEFFPGQNVGVDIPLNRKLLGFESLYRVSTEYALLSAQNVCSRTHDLGEERAHLVALQVRSRGLSSLYAQDPATLRVISESSHPRYAPGARDESSQRDELYRNWDRGETGTLLLCSLVDDDAPAHNNMLYTITCST